jgi:hypothetical protein
MNPNLNNGLVSNSEEFYGRKEEIENIYERIKTTQSTFIVGEKGLGKSLLLQYLYLNKDKYLENPDNYIYLFIEIKEENISSPNDFFMILLRGLYKKTKDKISISEEVSYENIRNIVFKLDKSGYKLIIFIDEFDLIADNNKFDATFYANLRALAPYKVAYVINSIKKIDEREDVITSPFFNIFVEIRLLPFNKEEAIELINNFSNNQVISSKDDLAFIISVAGFNPFFLKIACSNLFKFKSDKKELSKSDYEKITEEIRNESKPRIEYIWNNLSKEERYVLSRLSRSQAINEKNEYNLQDLEMKGYVIKREHKSFFKKPTMEYDIFSSIFKEYVIKKGDNYA